VSSVPVPQIAAWHDGRYVPGNMVVAAAGNLDHDAVLALVDGAFPERGTPAPVAAVSPDGPAPVLRFHEKETEQYHVCLGGRGIPRGDDRRFALRVLDTILGGSTSSRLFQEVREKRGLAYSVYSYANHYQDSGQVGLYVGTRPDRVREAVEVIGGELRRLQEDGVTEAELERARENVKGRTVLSMESTLTRMNRLGSSVLMGVPVLTVDEVLAAFDAVTLEDLAALARELWQPEQLSAAGVGGNEDVFRTALEAVSPQLAEAA
jgi:predicted Zn-dependent peptidase